jgi:hypothetical protein
LEGFRDYQRFGGKNLKSIEDLLELHEDWWKLENDKPILNVTYRERFPWMWLMNDHIKGMELVLENGSIATDGPLSPDMLSPRKLHPKTFTRGDLFIPVMVFGKIPWMEAICGVTPRLHVKANSIWAGFGQGIWPDDWWAKGYQVKVNNEWLKLLIESTRYCVEEFSDTFAIAQTSIMRGMMDIAAALMGDKNVIIAMYEHPDEFHALMDRLTEICIMVMKAQNDIIPCFHDGFVNAWGVWAPGTVTRHQEDEAAYISPKFYREFIMPYDRKLCQAFDYTTIHFHSAHHIHGDVVTDIPELGALQFSLEPPPSYGPTLKEWVPLWSRLIRKKPLILQAWNLTRDQINYVLRELPSQGLLLETYVQESGENYYIYRE